MVFDAAFQVIPENSNLDVAHLVWRYIGFGAHITDCFDGIHNAVKLFRFNRES